MIGLAAIAFALFSWAGPPCVVAKPETNLLIFLRHIADAVRIPKIGCEQFERNDFFGGIGAGIAHLLNGKCSLGDLDEASGQGSGVSSRLTLSGTRRHGVKDLAQSTVLVHDLDDVVRITRLWVKLYAR